MWLEIARQRQTYAAYEFSPLLSDCRGFLLKLDGRSKTWKKRYCVLCDACLYLYVDKEALSAIGAYSSSINSSNTMKQHVHSVFVEFQLAALSDPLNAANENISLQTKTIVLQLHASEFPSNSPYIPHSCLALADNSPFRFAATVCLHGYRVQSVGSLGVSGRRHAFELIPPESRGQMYFYFVAETETEKKRCVCGRFRSLCIELQ